MKELVKVEQSAATTSNVFNEILLERWIRFAGVAKKSEQTYRMAIKQMLKYFAAHNVIAPTREDLECWRDSLIEAGKSASTIALYITSCRLFFKWLALEGVYANVADNLKSKVKFNSAHKKDSLTDKQAAKLLQAVKGDTLKAKRDRAIVALLLTCGLRTIEIHRANVEDLRQQGGVMFLYVQGKGRTDKSDCVRIAPQVEVLILDYLKARGEVTSTAPLFVSCARRNAGDRISTQVISKMVKANLREIVIDSKKVSCHSCRHYAATTALMHGASLEAVKMVMRHRNVATTMIYVHTVERLKNETENLIANNLFSAASLGA